MRGTLRNYIGRCLTSRCREANSTARVREPPNKGRLTTCHFQSVAARQQGSELGLTALILEYVLDVNGLACRVFPGSGYGKLPRITADKTLSHRYSVSFGTRIGIPATAAAGLPTVPAGATVLHPQKDAQGNTIQGAVQRPSKADPRPQPRRTGTALDASDRARTRFFPSGLALE